MLGVLTKEQSEHVLKSEILGRIGCVADDKVYVVPITYVFDGKYIYAQSKEGLKLQGMRTNPTICFEVEQLENMKNWRTVIVQGKFEELKTKDSQTFAKKILTERLNPLRHSEAAKPSLPELGGASVIRELKAVLYRISILEISGRYEKSESN